MSWRTSRDYRKWRVRVIRRDKVCQICGSRKDRNAHHINCGAYFPEERYDVKNGITLCRKCHTQYHCNYHKSFREKTTKYDFENFKCLVSYIKGLCNVEK